MGGYVFISYRHGPDESYVEELAQLLQSAGVSTWHDKQIVGGDRWDRTIKQRIDGCDAFLVVMTPEAENSDWVMRELTQAEKTHRPILPLLLSGDGFFRLNNLQFEDVLNGHMPGPEFIAQLRDLTSRSVPEARPVDDDSAYGDPNRGRDVEAEITLEFLDAAKGCTLPVTLHSPMVCDLCGGSGEIDDQVCGVCQGQGGVTKLRTLNVRIPAGVADGQRIRLAGRGEPGQQGRPPGDLHLLTRVKPDTVFGRDGDDLTLSVELTFTEAVLGLDVRVPTLEGTVTVRVPAGTPPGRILRVRGRGLPRRDGSLGDMLVTIDVAVPVKGTLSSAALAAIEELAQLVAPADRSLLEGAIMRQVGAF